MQQVTFVNKLTRSFYELPPSTTIAAIDKDTLEFCSATNEDRDDLMNHHLPGVVRLAADMNCPKIQLRYRNQPPDRTLNLKTENLKRFIDRLNIANK